MAPREFGATAWGRGWLRTIERIDAAPHPGLPKARSLARNGKVTVTTSSETLTADVQDGGAVRQVRVLLPRWKQSEQEVADRILAAEEPVGAGGDLPDALFDTLTAAGVAIAVSPDEAAATCTCRSRIRPCAHILATLYALILQIDERPVTAVEIRSATAVGADAQDSAWISLAVLDPAAFYA